MMKVVFACVHNAGRSQMAAALFNRLADPGKARALSAGTQPADAVQADVVTVMRELDVDLAGAVPQKLTADFARGADWLITMGCGEACPVIPGARREDWPLPDPKGKSLDEVRAIRNEIADRTGTLVRRLGVARG